MNNWALITPVDTPDKDNKGFELLEENVIKCADCNKKLVEIIKVKESDKLTELIIICPCGGSSFKYKIHGETYFQAVEGRSINDIEILDNPNNMKVIINE